MSAPKPEIEPTVMEIRDPARRAGGDPMITLDTPTPGQVAAMTCPTCKATPGAPCVIKNRQYVNEGMHGARWSAAYRVADRAARVGVTR